jgi:rubredoxin
MRLGRTLALFIALLPWAASATTWRVDFVVEDLELLTVGSGSSFLTLPPDGIVRGVYFYDDTPFNSAMSPGRSEISWDDGETGAFVRIGPDLFTLIASEDVSDGDFLTIRWTDDGYVYDEEEPENSIYYDYYEAYASLGHPDGLTRLDLLWQEIVYAHDVDQGAPLPDLLTGTSFTDIPDPAAPPATFPEFQFRIEQGSDIAMLTGDVTELSIHVSPVPEPEQSASVGAGVVLLAALARRRRGSARIAA